MIGAIGLSQTTPWPPHGDEVDGHAASRGPASPPALSIPCPNELSPDAPAAARALLLPRSPYINPEIITDANGTASITIPLADSITTWRMAMLASTAHGALGSGTSSLKVFQDFFVDLDLPVTLTQGDRVSIPVAIYNYSGSRGDVSLKLATGGLVLARRRHSR